MHRGTSHEDSPALDRALCARRFLSGKRVDRSASARTAGSRAHCRCRAGGATTRPSLSLSRNALFTPTSVDSTPVSRIQPGISARAVSTLDRSTHGTGPPGCSAGTAPLTNRRSRCRSGSSPGLALDHPYQCRLKSQEIRRFRFWFVPILQHRPERQTCSFRPQKKEIGT